MSQTTKHDKQEVSARQLMGAAAAQRPAAAKRRLCYAQYALQARENARGVSRSEEIRIFFPSGQKNPEEKIKDADAG